MQQEMIYEQAATIVMNYSKNHDVKFVASKTEILDLLNQFKEKFAPDVLKSLDDDKLLSYLFLTTDGTNDSLCYHLEFNPKLKRVFGSISGGSSYKYGLFQRQEDGEWITGTPKTPQILTKDEALQLGKKYRDYLVDGCSLIQSRSLESVEDYEKLDDDLNELIGSFSSYAWVLKYFHLIFPDKFIGWYVTDWLRHILYGFGITPSEKYYGMVGQLSLIKKRTGYMATEFQDICYTMFGDIRHFYRLGSSNESVHYAEKWKEKGVVAIGWNKIGTLLNYIKNGSLDKDKIITALMTHYYQDDKRIASRKASEIKAFYETSATSVITVMDGTRLIAFVDDLSPYFYDETEDMSHLKTGVWHMPFDESDELPEDEGNLTTCYEIKKPKNLLFLYNKFYWTRKSNEVMTTTGNENSSVAKNVSTTLSFNTTFSSSFSRNRIIFGAPGTGKSFLLEKERKSLIDGFNEDNYERVTFHPDYSYANFVGTYKPVMVTEHSVSPVDNDTMYVLSVLTDKRKTAQKKYDELFDKFKDGDLTRLPLLLGLYTDDSFETRKADGTPTANNNSVERNHGISIRKYINLIDGSARPKGISYEYVPGPFMRLYVKALKNAQTDNPQPYLLIIEEINRANVAAVFGDVFQLLDRDDDGVSQYSIQASEDIKKYLAKEMGGEPDDYSKIRIPNNMFIWATMNSADQGVFPMDTAFKRRWDFSYIGIDDNDNDIRDKYVLLANGKQKVEWNKLRKAINNFLASKGINEDKQLGPYFIGRQIVVPKNNEKEIDGKRFADAFKNKVIMYLFEDAAKQKRPSLFAGCQDKGSRYSDICKEFDEKGINIFADEIIAASGYEDMDNHTDDNSTEN